MAALLHQETSSLQASFAGFLQEEDLRNLLQRRTFRRQCHQVSSFPAPQLEMVLPVVLTQSQRECYKTQLARAYDVLIEPKAPRQTSHRAGQLRAICTSLRKVRYLLLAFVKSSAAIQAAAYMFLRCWQSPECPIT